MANELILVVDDSQTDFLYVKKILQGGGYRVEHADSGAVAIERAAELNPVCIVMDVVMPVMNGFQATRALSRNPDTAHIPIIMLSSKDQAFDKVWAERQGATDYVVKPADAKELLTKIMAVAGV